MKKIVSLILSLMIIFALAVSPVTASAIITTYGGTFAILPGNTRSSSPEYNYAWLDNIVVRDDAMAVTAKAIRPMPTDHPGSHTYDEFIKEVEQYSVLFDLDENTVAAAYTEVTYAMYYLVTAAGMTGTLDEMRVYLQDYGIRLPGNEDMEDKAAIAVTYAALKYDAVYVLYEKKAEIPKGTTLDGATVIILSALTDTMLPSGINTLTGMAVNTVKAYVTRFEQLPISQNPEADEIFHWAKIITAAKNDYKVPLAPYDEATTAQKEYVDYAYYATILNTMYDINLDPIYLIIAMQSDDELALQKLILKTMLDEKGVAYDSTMSCEALFDLAEQNGCLALEDEFYSDVLRYEIVVAEDCERIWFTPFALAEQLEGGSNDFVSIRLGEKAMAPASTADYKLNTALKNETIKLSVSYDNLNGKTDEAVYEFIIKKDASLNEENSVSSENDMVAEVEDFVNTIIPTDNEKASQVVDHIFNGIDSELQTTTSEDGNEDVLTTYNVNENTTFDVSEPTSETTTEPTERFDFDYLEELIDGVYATDADGNIVTSYSIPASDDDSEEETNIIENAVQTVKENPEILVAPTGVVAIGSLAGFFFSKRRHGSVMDDENDTEETEE